jgi:hypothetical protein
VHAAIRDDYAAAACFARAAQWNPALPGIEDKVVRAASRASAGGNISSRD